MQQREEAAAALVALPRTIRHQLPQPPTPLLAREQEIQQAEQLLLHDHVRLLTLVGPPGVGKTRLALALGDAVQAQFAQGAAFVDLSPVRDPALVLPTIAAAFGLHQQGERTPVEQLDSYLRGVQVLLVLDNFEHVLSAGTDVARLLQQAADLVVLITSRAALNVRSEHVFAVPPLDVQSRNAPAVALFAQRARACRPGFVVDASNRPTISAICAKLDGLPLAIELAAARSILFSPEDILARLEERFELLRGGLRDAAERHQTLREAIAWSEDLLTASEQTLFRRLSVFVGGFILDAAEAVSDANMIDDLLSLVRNNLVRMEDATTPTRYRMLETIREYAWQRLVSSGEAGETQRRHARWVEQMLEQGYPRSFLASQGEWFARLDHEHDNVRQALRWSIGAGDAETALRLCGWSQWFWYARGYLAEGGAWVEQALALGGSASGLARALALRSAGSIAINRGQLGRAIGFLEEAVELNRQNHVPGELAMALGLLGVGRLAAGDYDAAQAAIDESLAVFASIDDEWGTATAQEVLGAIAALRRDFLLAQERFEESLRLRRELVNRPATATVLGHLALVAQLSGQHDRAAGLYRESIALAQEVGNAAGLVRCLGQVGALALAHGLDRGRIARLCSAVAHHHEVLKLPTPPVERAAAQRLSTTLRDGMSTVSLAGAWLAGRTLSLERTVKLGLDLLDQVAPLVAQPTESARLTRRELEVAELVAHGLTNRQIAEEIVIAQRTVDTHVERILSKLSFATRAQIAAWVTAQARKDT